MAPTQHSYMQRVQSILDDKGVWSRLHDLPIGVYAYEERRRVVIGVHRTSAKQGRVQVVYKSDPVSVARRVCHFNVTATGGCILT